MNLKIKSSYNTFKSAWNISVKFDDDFRTTLYRSLKLNFPDEESINDWKKYAEIGFREFSQGIKDYSLMDSEQRLDQLEQYLNKLTKKEIDRIKDNLA